VICLANLTLAGDRSLSLKLLNPSTDELGHSPACQLKKSSTKKLINLKTHQLKNSPTYTFTTSKLN